MSLSTLNAGRVAYDKAAILRRAYHHARFGLQIIRARRELASERNKTLSRCLTKAWAEAKAEARDILRQIEREAQIQAFLAEHAKAKAALAARFDNDAAAIRFEIEREHYRQHFDGARIETLRAALASIGA